MDAKNLFLFSKKNAFVFCNAKAFFFFFVGSFLYKSFKKYSIRTKRIFIISTNCMGYNFSFFFYNIIV
jgi:hypothetical protein